MLEVSDLHAYYGKSHILQGVTFNVQEGEIVSLLGRNGVGRSTTAKAIMGEILPQGSIRFKDQEIAGKKSFEIANLGLGYVPENRDIFPTLTVRQNLQLGMKSTKANGRWGIEEIFNMFPNLADRAEIDGGVLSGGEQQMVAISRALMARPKLLLMDEPSLGLAPLVVREIARSILAINREDKVSVILVEQNSRMALKLSSRAYVLETGRVALEGASEELVNNEDVRRLYLGA